MKILAYTKSKTLREARKPGVSHIQNQFLKKELAFFLEYIPRVMWDKKSEPSEQFK